MNGRPQGAPTNVKIKIEHGITLIALIITIILMLILAGVTLHFTLGENGILKNAELAGNKYKQASDIESNLLENIDEYISEGGNYPENSPQISAGARVAMPNGWYSKTSATYSVPQVKKVSNSKKTASVYAVSDGQNNTIPIPKDFYYVGGNKNTGIVISDNQSDEKKYANASNGDVGKDLKGNQFVWIPCSIENYHKVEWGDSSSRWDFTTRIFGNNTNRKIWRILYRKI